MRREYKIILALTGFLSAVLFLLPEERVLGNLIRLVYLHAALMWAGLLILTLGIVVGLVNKQKCRSFLFVGACFWIAATVLGLLASELAWGGMLLEPRLVGSIFISVTFLGILYLLNTLPFKAVFPLTAFSVASAWGIVFRSGVFHPDNPIGKAENPAMKYIFLLISVIIIVIAALLIKNLNKFNKFKN